MSCTLLALHSLMFLPRHFPALQLCKHEFVFTPVYAKDAPTLLPWAELIAGLIKRAVGGVRVAHRVWVVACVWLIAVPWITCLAWRLAFLRSFDEVPRLLRERWNVLAIATDCIQVRSTARHCVC
jgi:E3 ubiquitin-protein ligase MARCH6